jgi:hypothetical protein
MTRKQGYYHLKSTPNINISYDIDVILIIVVNQSKTRMEKVKFKIMSEIINLTNTGPKQN